MCAILGGQLKKRKREKGRGKKNDECIYTYAYQQDNSSLIFSTAIFNAFSLGVPGSGSLHFVPFRSIFNGTRPSTRGLENYRGAAHRHRSETRKSNHPLTLFFRRGKLSLPTGQEATNRAQRPRWWLISVHGNEPCYQELISPAYCHLLVVLPRPDADSHGRYLSYFCFKTRSSVSLSRDARTSV